MMYRVQLTPTAADTFKSLNPEIRKHLKAELKELAGNPYAGKELRDELAGFRSYRIKRYRIVYKVDDGGRFLNVYAVAHRREIYDVLSEIIKG